MIGAFTSARRLPPHRIALGAAISIAAGLAAAPALAQSACPCYTATMIRTACMRIAPAARYYDRSSRSISLSTEINCGRHRFRAFLHHSSQRGSCLRSAPGTREFKREDMTAGLVNACLAVLDGEGAKFGQ